MQARVDPNTVMVSWTEMEMPFDLVNSTYMQNGRYSLDITDYSLLLDSASPHTDNRTFRCLARGIANPASLTTTTAGLTVGITQATLTTKADPLDERNDTTSSTTTLIYNETMTTNEPPSMLLVDTELMNSSEIMLLVAEPIPPGEPKALKINSTSLVLSWLPSDGPISNYSVSVRKGNYTSSWDLAVNQPPGASSEYTVYGLMPYEFYQFHVRAHFSTGYFKDSPVSKLIRTAQGKPSQPPGNVTVTTRGPFTIAVSWKPPPPNSINGVLQNYKVMVSPGSQVIKLGPSTLSTVITNRKPFTLYIVTIAVVNSANETGPFSPTVNTSTDESVPGPPHGVIQVGKNPRSLQVFWNKPNLQNGKILFYYAYIRRRDSFFWSRFKTSKQHHLFLGLEVFTDYIIKVSASTNAGEGPNSTALFEKTDVTAPSEPHNITITVIGPGTARISWMEPFIFYNSIDSYTVSYRDINVSTPMLAAEITNTSRLLRNLQDDATYEVTVRAFTMSTFLGRGLLQGEASLPQRFVMAYVPPTSGLLPGGTMKPGEDAGRVVGVVFALFVLLGLILGVLGFVILRMRKKDRMSFEKHGNGMAPTFCRPDDLEEPAIHISKFESHVIACHANSDGGFAAEYEEIQHVPTSFPATFSSDVENKLKNRYTNIVSYDSSRVSLQPLPGIPNSDYINANYIDGFNRQKAYIATQGALKTTFDDFWRLVWEQKSVVIVMITKLEERGRRKCDRYWPAKGTPERYNELEVTLELKEKFASYTLRTFLLKHRHKKTPENYAHGKVPERRVYHFHYTDWPDHGVPPYTLPVLSFIQRSSAANPTDAGPIIVHCSAGVGRTGTYIVIDTMLKQMQAEEKVNVFGFLKRIRTQRNYLVQTEEQYVFIHDVLLEWLRAGNTVVKSTELRQYVDRMTLPDEVGRVVLDEQFNLIMKMKPRDYEFSKARQSKHKNRDMDLIPVERSRVPISGVPGVDGYINASFLQGYRRQNEYIVTQYPSAETMEDFWKMLWEHNSTTIVTLTDDQKVQLKEDEPIYWPTNVDEPLTLGALTITLCEEEHSNISFITREFLVQSSQDDDQLNVRQYHCSYWPDCCSPLHTAFDLIYAVQKRNEFLERSNKETVGPITVHDRSGGCQAGTFCALSTLHQEMIHEEAVDIYKTVKLYAAKRPNLITSREDYYYLFKALQSCHSAELQIRSLRRQGSRRGILDGPTAPNGREWNFLRSPGHVDPGSMRLSDSVRNSSLDSDGFYRTRSQTMSSAGPQRHPRPSKFWHRRTKSEKRKPLNPPNAATTRRSSIATTPGDRTPSESLGEVYELINVRSKDSTPNSPTSNEEFVLIGETGVTSEYPVVSPEIHESSGDISNGNIEEMGEETSGRKPKEAAYRPVSQLCDDDRECMDVDGEDDDGDDDIPANECTLNEDLDNLNMNGEMVNLNVNGAIDLYDEPQDVDMDTNISELNGEVTPLDLPAEVIGKLSHERKSYYSQESVNSAQETEPLNAESS
ncbi:tyrosine-protein phosphatase 99A isoform X1 [Strongylocentrotus purpuratus]|uniref:Protein-tyrosine-phosphatase n=1 Tax=Strongylocentrotus purpuratus TaxID=7668 RepID=A0A7M7MYE2_STRPU|nr:tyrosine-protein phosphatase 99A isoform X1 [Strongylocentrotus purpuratus]